MSIFGRAIAYVVLAVALLAAAVTLNDRKYPVRNATKPELSAAKSDLDAELARCKAIGLEAGGRRLQGGLGGEPQPLFPIREALPGQADRHGHH